PDLTFSPDPLAELALELDREPAAVDVVRVLSVVDPRRLQIEAGDAKALARHAPIAGAGEDPHRVDVAAHPELSQSPFDPRNARMSAVVICSGTGAEAAGASDRG